jgi:hypothetical protein
VLNIGVPEPDRTLAARGRHPVAVGAERHPVDLAAVGTRVRGVAGIADVPQRAVKLSPVLIQGAAIQAERERIDDVGEPGEDGGLPWDAESHTPQGARCGRRRPRPPCVRPAERHRAPSPWTWAESPVGGDSTGCRRPTTARTVPTDARDGPAVRAVRRARRAVTGSDADAARVVAVGHSLTATG